MALVVKNPPAKAGDIRDTGLIPRLTRSPGENMKPTPVFLPVEPMDRGAWLPTVHRIAKSQT